MFNTLCYIPNPLVVCPKPEVWPPKPDATGCCPKMLVGCALCPNPVLEDDPKAFVVVFCCPKALPLFIPPAVAPKPVPNVLVVAVPNPEGLAPKALLAVVPNPDI